jgi:hypothetical protein
MSIVPDDIRADLLRLHGGKHAEVFRALQPPYSPATLYRALTGASVAPDVVEYIKAQHVALTYRLCSDAELEVALAAAHAALLQAKGKSLPLEDLSRELCHYLKRKLEGEH